jgi:hypothetical protein
MKFKTIINLIIVSPKSVKINLSSQHLRKKDVNVYKNYFLILRGQKKKLFLYVFLSSE